MRAVIVGASGGIGRALTLGLLAQGQTVHAFSRSGTEFSKAAISGHIDLTDEASIAGAAEQVAAGGPPDLVVVATGLLSAGDRLQPEKSYRQQSAAAFSNVFEVNTIGPALVAKHFIPIMPRKERGVFAAISARVGSISDNRIGGWHAYRASKAALNMLIRNYAIEQARRNKQFIAVGLHPGTVDTDLSKPFQSNVPADRLFSTDQSAAYLLKVISELEPANSGKVYDWQGKEVPT